MHVRLYAILLLTVTAALSAEDKIPVRLGDADSPVVDKLSFADIQLTNGSATLQIAATRPRAVQFIVLSGPKPNISCGFGPDRQATGVPIAMGSWYRVDQPTDCSVVSHENFKLQLRVLNAAGSVVAQLKTNPAGNAQVEGIDSASPVISVEIGFQQHPGNAPVLKFLLVAVVLLAILCGLIVAIVKLPLILKFALPWFIELGRFKHRIATMFSSPTGQPGSAQATASAANATPMPKPALDPGTALIPSDSSIKQPSEELVQLRQQLADLATKQSNLAAQIAGFASLKNLNETAADVRRELKGLHELVEQLRLEHNKNLLMLQGEFEAFIRNLAEHEKSIEQLRADRSTDLRASLKRGLQGHFENGPGREIAQQMDMAVSRYVSESLPSNELLGCRERATALGTAINKLLMGLTPPYPELEEKLRPLLEQSRQVETEITDLLPQDGNSRLKFAVELEPSKPGSEYIVEGVATGLARQIAKLENPVEHFDYQLQVLAANAAQTAADFLDSNVDRQRNDGPVQNLLDDLLRAGGLEQINPAPSEGFRALEHHMVDMLPRPEGITDGPTVAKLLSRGFRRGKSVLRQASVILYE